MKLKQMHIVYDPNHDTVGILHRPGDGSAMSVLPADQEFVHALFGWMQESSMGWGVWGRLINLLSKALLGKKRFRRRVTDRRGIRYDIVLTITQGKPAKNPTPTEETEDDRHESTDGEAEGGAK